MTSRDFCYWLQGYFEVAEAGEDTVALDDVQIGVIKKHLSLVFKHEIDPSMGDQTHQAELNAIHSKPTSKWTEEQWQAHFIKEYGPCPHEGWKVGIHGWYDPKFGTLRC